MQFNLLIRTKNSCFVSSKYCVTLHLPHMTSWSQVPKVIFFNYLSY